jgi:exonuclease III
VSPSSNLEVSGFRNFLNEVELVDLPILGRRFTWYHANGLAMSRIDRIWVSSEWLDAWGDCSVWVCHRDISDHCPLILKSGNIDWGPSKIIPF